MSLVLESQAPPSVPIKQAAPSLGVRRWIVPHRNDPRIPFAVMLTVYTVLGCTVLRFNRTPLQMFLTVASSCFLDMLLCYCLRGHKLLIPLSAYITGVSLALLVNYSHNNYLLFLPVYFAIGSKYLFTYQGRHVYNPSMFGVVLSLLVGGNLITAAPAYQWGGHWAMAAMIIVAALTLFVFKIGRSALILSFLGFYFLQLLLRAYVMRYYLPFEAIVFGSFTSAAFFLFTFYMITDPKTSPASPKAQVVLALALTAVDLFLHKLQSAHTLFFALFIVQSAQLAFCHTRRLWGEGIQAMVSSFQSQQTRGAWGLLGLIGLAMVAIYQGFIHPDVSVANLPFKFVEISAATSGIQAKPNGEIFQQVDLRVQHIAKWLLSAGDAAAVADYDNDGLLDLFLTNPLKTAEDRNSLYRNAGHFHFQRADLPALREMSHDPVQYGLSSCPIFSDYDNDGDQDLFLGVSYGKSRLLRNLLAETGVATFEDMTAASGVDAHTISLTANFFDIDRDGRLDLLVGNALSPFLDRYDPPRPTSIFSLPQPEYPGDRRMFPFMHKTWDNAHNGGLNLLYRNTGGGRFEQLDSRSWGMPETHWSLAIGTGDLNNDGWTDLYIANDFGPDDLYLNQQGRHFLRVQGRVFGSVGKDTYKGMNSSLADLDRNGYLDIYVSNVHVPLQAEGSLLWMTYPTKGNSFVPRFRDEATQRGALNEHRFGWGGAIGDLNNDGWLDIVQVNGMVDDTFDKRFAKCPSYWYVNEKLMRSGPEIHTHADMWGDLRGYCINPKDAHVVYLSRGARSRLQFIDVAKQVGWRDDAPSRGAVLVDFDNDGDLDTLVTRQFAPPLLYRNTLYETTQPETTSTGTPHWIGFALEGDGTSCNRDAAGSRVTLRYREHGQEVQQMREVTIANAFAAQGDRRVLFGLSDSTDAVEVAVSWCGAPPQSYGRFQVGQYHTIKQSSTQLTKAVGDGRRIQ